MQKFPCNRPWRPIGLWDVETPTFSRQSADRWQCGCQPYTPALFNHKSPGTHFRESKQRPAGLQNSDLTTTLPSIPNIYHDHVGSRLFEIWYISTRLHGLTSHNPVGLQVYLQSELPDKMSAQTTARKCVLLFYSFVLHPIACIMK
jgi:hypothetical protein